MKRILLLFSIFTCCISSYGQLTAPFTETFSSSGLPTGWANNSVDPWKFSGNMGYDAGTVGDHTGSPGSHFAWIDGSSTANASAPLTTDSIDLTAVTNPELNFWLSSYSLNTTAGYNTFSVDFYDGSTWHNDVYTHQGHTGTAWKYVVVNLTTYTITGKCLVRFDVDMTTSTTAYFNDIAIDDVTVGNQPTCPKPSNLVSSNITSSSVTLSWLTGGSANAQIEYGAPGFTLGTGTQTVATTSTNFVLGSLSPATSYDIYVRDSCSATDTSLWEGPISVTTACVNTMSGTYTLNKAQPTSGTNFNSFSDLQSDLNLCGVTGPVVINIVPGSGPYREQFTLSSVVGLSATNTLTINGNGESIADSGMVGDNAIIMLDDIDHMTIDSLNIIGYALTNQFGIQFMNGSDSNNIRNCNITLNPLGTSSSLGCIVFSGSTTSLFTSGNNGNYNLIENNALTGGYYGVRHNGGGSTSPTSGNQFVDNVISDYHNYGIYNQYQDSVIVDGNEFHRLNRASVGFSYYAIYNTFVRKKSVISNNWIHDGFAQATSSTAPMYAVYTTSSDAVVGEECLVYNNLVANNDAAGNRYLIYNTGSDNWKNYHNTIVINSPTVAGTGGTRALYQTGTVSGVEWKNNLVYVDRATTGSNYCVYNSSSSVVFDNNAYHHPQIGTGANHFGYYSGNQTSFADWQAANSSAYDQNSAEGDPFFVDLSMGDFTPRAAYFDNIGANLSTVVANDFNGMPRSTTPDPGVYEFTPPPGPDMAVANIYSGGASCGATTDLIVEIINQGTDSATTFTVNYSINGVPGTPVVKTGLWRTGDVDSTSITGIPIGTSITSVVTWITATAPGLDTDPSNDIDSIHLRTGLSGTFTVDVATPASATNYISLVTLVDDLNAYGVCGPVTVNVVTSASAYIGQLLFNDIVGTSSTNTITINGNGNTVEHLATSGSERATIILNGTDWLTIDSLNVVAAGSGSQYGFGISLTNEADHNSITNCSISVDSSSSSQNFSGITISGSTSSATASGKSGNYNLISGNTITGGYYGISCYGESSDSTNGNMFVNNMISDFYYYGIRANYSDHVVIEGNEVSRPNRSTIGNFYAVYLFYANSPRVSANKIHSGYNGNPNSTSTSYGLYLYYAVGTASDPAIISNNVISDINNDGTLYGIYSSQGANMKIVHNTIVSDDPVYNGTSNFGSNTRLIYATSAMPASSISNNVFYLNRAAGSSATVYMVYFNGAVGEMNNNSYFAPSGAPSWVFGYYNSTQQFDLATWQNATGLDANSAFGDQYFVNTAIRDYQPQSAMLDGNGLDFSAYVTTDVNGVTRGNPSDIGAYEFTAAPCTGLSQISLDTVTHNSATVIWASSSDAVTIEWGPVGYKQASQAPQGTTNVPLGDSSSVIAGLSQLTCYDYYLSLNCTSPLPGAPPVMGPFTFCTDCAGGPLSGTYTIGGAAGPTNFPDLDSAMIALNGCGINGPVVFNMNGGTHSAFTIGNVSGSSALNTITFNGSANHGDSIIATGGTAAMDFNGAQYITFNDVYVSNVSGNFVVWLHNSTKNITINGSVLLGDVSTTSSSRAVVAATASSTSSTSSGDNAENIIINDCDITGGYYGISFYGPSTTLKSTNFNITDSRFSDQYYYGIRANYIDSSVFSGNVINAFRNTFSYAIYMWYDDKMTVTENEVKDASYGLYSYYTGRSAASAASESNFINNMLNGSNYGIYIYGNKYVNVYHNTAVGGTSAGLYISGSSVQGPTSSDDLDIRNNIFANLGTSYAYQVQNNPFGTFTVDNNVYHAVGANVARVISTNYANLSAWQIADATKNVNSVEGDPLFIGANDLHVLGAISNDMGDNTVGVLTDIDGDTRPKSPSTIVDAGADEHTPVTADFSILSASLHSGTCLSTNDTVMIEAENVIGPAANLSTTPLVAHYDVQGPINSNGTITLSVGIIPSNGSVQLMATNVDMSVPGVYTLNAWIDSSAINQAGANDTLASTVSKTIYSVWDVTPKTTQVITTTTDTVILEAKSPFLNAGDFIITEQCQFRTGNGSPTGGWPSYLVANDYIEITGVPGSDLGGITLEQWNNSGLAGTYTFPAGTFLSPNGTAVIAVGELGSSTPSPVDFYYHGNGTFSGTWSSSTPSGRILKDANGMIIDAVISNSFTWSAASGVTAVDWTGTVPSTGSTSGNRLEGPDMNNGTGWVGSSTSPQDPNVLNANVPLPAAIATPGFGWTLNGSAFDTLPKTVAGPFTQSGTYEYVATFTTPCGVFSDTVDVIVNLPGSCTPPATVTPTVVACDSVVIDWTGAKDSAIVSYVAAGGTPSTGTLVIGDSTFTITGTSASTSYDVYVANICGTDTAISGPHTFNTGTVGAPVASFTVNQVSGSLVVGFDGSGSTGNGNTYAWDFGDGNSSTAMSPSHTYSTGGPYSIKLTVTNACGTSDTTITIADIGLGENELSSNMFMYPNPAKDVVTIELSIDGGDHIGIRVMDISGKEIMNISEDKTSMNFETQIDVSNLASGVYMIEVSNGNSNALRRLIVE